MTTHDGSALAHAYIARVTDLMRRILEDEQPAIARAAKFVVDAILRDRPIHVFGTGGHSVMASEELFYRAGGLVAVNPVLEEGVGLRRGGVRSTYIERTPGYADAVLANQDLQPGDVLIIVNAYGINACTIDAARYAHARGVIVVAATSVAFQKALPQGHPSRHPDGADLADEADVVIDTKIPMGDALMEIPGVTQPVGPSSTFTNAAALNLLVLESVRQLAERGVDPPIWRSANSPGGDEANVAHLARFMGRIGKL
jgi:uncharacterized phosphosugar-binding protein